MSNLFGRATHNLVLNDQLQAAYAAVDREMKTVADLQRSLLPASLPQIPGLELASHYQTSRYAGGDYYDFFPLPGRRWGILVADVSGHGAPAAVLMAVTHAIAHGHGQPPNDPAELMCLLNRQLTGLYTGGSGSFVTAFYGIYDPASRRMAFTNAGHPPPRLRRGNAVSSLDGQRSMPLGIEEDERYHSDSVDFSPGDLLMLYTDGITEARDPADLLFGLQRLDDALNASPSADEAIVSILAAVEDFTNRAPPTDDRTLLAVRVV
jgi:sigma-B regulation protein RsbU (phosphoserine phosphatase)